MSETGLVEASAKLRVPFDDRVVGKLPRVTCKDCSDRNTQCQKHQKSKCNVCGAYISTAHIHLDYVGHAETTDRLLSVDPAWSWEPLAFDERGLPMFERNQKADPVRLWIKLTVCGVTRIGVGSVDGGAFDAEKQLIGDAIRNAAMRFGVALDLWAKSELESTLEGHGEAPEPPTNGRAAPKAGGGSVDPSPVAQVADVPSVRPPPGRRAVVDTSAAEQPAERSEGAAVPPPAAAPSITAGKLRGLVAALKGAGHDTDDDQRKFAADTLKRPVDRLDTLTVADAEHVTAALKTAVTA